MGLIERLRRAEQTAQRGVELARETWEDNTRKLRRRMRIHPKVEPQIRTVVRWAGESAEHEVEPATAILPAEILLPREKKAA